MELNSDNYKRLYMYIQDRTILKKSNNQWLSRNATFKKMDVSIMQKFSRNYF